jgi:GTPase
MAQRSGFAAFFGRPNVGKSTLLNRLLGQKLAIVSPKPQTTRTRLVGIVNAAEGQVAFVDTPGIHQAKGALNQLMVDHAVGAADEADVLIVVVTAEGLVEGKAPSVSDGNRAVLQRLATFKKPTILAINKVDTVKKVLLLPFIDLYRKAFPFVEVVPISALKGEGIDTLLSVTLGLMPEAEPMYPQDVFTDQAERALVGELVREQVLRHCRQEVPYSAAVVVEVFDESERDTPPPAPKAPKKGTKAKAKVKTKAPARRTGLVRIHANIFLERESQKAILIGKRGQMLKVIGTDARERIERLLGTNVFLSLQVKVEPRWTERADGLRKVGYERIR